MKVLNPCKNLLLIDTLFAPPDFLNFPYYSFMVIQYLSRMILNTLCSRVLGECYITWKKKFFFFEDTFFFFKFLLIYFIYLFLAVLGLRFCARAFYSCGKRGPLFIAVRGPLTIAASLVAEHRLRTRRLSSCGSRAQPLRGMWDLPRPGLEPVSPALAGGFSTTAPPGKPQKTFLKLRCGI